MNILSYINKDTLHLSLQDTVAKAVVLFQKSTYTHIPVIENEMLLGNLAEEDIQGLDTASTIEEHQYLLNTFFVRESTNWLDTLEVFAQNDANVVPVLDKNSEYLGYYDLVDIISFFTQTPFINEPGGVLVIEKNSRDYSFGEVVQIVEGNNGKILGLFISNMQDNTVQITLKIGQSTLNDIIQSFRRYKYHIVLGSDDDIFMQDLKDRSNYLKKFLNI